MRAGGANGKGASFERKICVALSLWITHGERSDCFWRSSQSGGRATMAFARGVRLDRQAGDLCAIAPEGHALTDVYFFEMKHRASIKLESFLLHNRGPLAEWWKTACAEAKKYNREPVLIAKGNRTPIIIVTKRNTNSRFGAMSVLMTKTCVISLFDTLMKMPFKATGG